jgi:dephospho-CoA kinase
MQAEAGPGREPIVIGVLGGIASGKSTVARLLAGTGGVVLDADAMVSEELASPQLRQRLLAAFGGGIFTPDGRVDRQALSQLVFASPEARSRLEGWVHPRVRARIRAGLEEARAQGRNPLVLDVPLLLENDADHGLASRCDFLVFVDADPKLRDRRAVEARGWAAGEVARREGAQMPLADKAARARHVVRNQGDRAALEESVHAILRAEGLA